MINELVDIKLGSEDLFKKFYIKAVTLASLSILPLLYGIQHIFNIVYASMNRKLYNPWSPLSLLDGAIFFVFFELILNTFSYNMNGTWNERLPTDTRSQVYARNLSDDSVNESVIWTICIILLWIRAFFLLRFNEYMGKFIIVVQRVIPDLSLFFIFYLIQLCFFSLLAEGFFRRLDSFNSTWKAFRTLFYASLGTFDFEELYDAEFG